MPKENEKNLTELSCLLSSIKEFETKGKNLGEWRSWEKYRGFERHTYMDRLEGKRTDIQRVTQRRTTCHRHR